MNSKDYSSTPYLWLLFSGGFSLCYQILWIHYFRLLLGNTVYSFSWSSGVFLFGISVGTLLSYYYLKKTTRNLLSVYSLIEFLVTVLSFISFSILIDPPEFIINFLSPHSLLKDGLMAFFFIFPVTTVMGLSFPILTEVFHRHYKVEKLYGANTIGGGLGIFLLGFISIIYLGYQKTFWLTCLLNLGLSIWVYSSKNVFSYQKCSEEKVQKITFSLAAIAFLSGFILLGLEVVWFRTLEIIINDRSYISTLLLFIILISLGTTAWITPRYFKSNLKPLFLLVTGAIFLMWGAEFISEEAFLVARGYPRVTFIKTFYVITVFLIPLFLLGFTFPALLNHKDWTGVETAKLLLLNTFGGMIGTLLVSYTVIEYWGMKSFYLIAMACLIAILTMLPKDKLKYPSLVVAVLFSVSFIFLHQNKIYIHQEEKVLLSKESPSGLFSLIDNNDHLEIYSGNYRIVSPYGTQNVTHAQNALAFFPALFIEKPKTILSMGTGYGISLGAFLSLNPEQVTSVEILKSVNDVSYQFRDENKEWYKDPRVTKVIDDARGFLKRSKKQFDIISSNIASPYTTSGSLFLSKEYFMDVLEHLSENGVYSQLVWGAHLPEIVHTFNEVFPFVTAIPGYEDTDLVLIGSKKELTMKRDLHTFDSSWPLYKGKLSREETINLGKQILKESLAKKPEFIISDHYASLTHNWDRGLKFFWIYGH